MNQSQIAQKRFEFENDMTDEKIYNFDHDELMKLLNESRPWKQDPDHFKKVKISAVALIKMVMHAQSGGDIEVMGLMQGYPVGDTMYVMDTFGLPVEGTETRVNAGKEADDFMLDHQDKSPEVDRPEFICGWYHSHPGYGCWLSGIDVQTQQSMQMIQDPAIAIVVDPKRTMSAGKVELGCFRAYQNSYADKLQNSSGRNQAAMIPGEKFEDFGLHAHKYYQVPHQIFKSSLDAQLLESLWNEYWIHNLASSPLITNQEFICKSVINVVQKLKMLTSGHISARRSSSKQVLDETQFQPLEQVTSKLAVEVTHGILVEALKSFLFTFQQQQQV